jgi:2-dehydro-3-deoxyphosphogluconate aldolase/(4S)-4-hydroxy-2-oxoglutarate aldolase
MDIKSTIKALLKDGSVFVFNRDDLDVVRTAEALRQAGINNMEVTCRVSNPLKKIKLLKKELPDFVVGAASLIDFPKMLDLYNLNRADDPLPTIKQAVEAGADYLVSAANFSEETYRNFAGKLPMIPGCGTITEILTQFSLGANFAKIFPAKQLGGPDFVKAFDPPVHKMISVIPTGGTDASNIPQYIAAEVLVVGGSFSAIEKPTFKKIVEQQDYKLLTEEFAKAKKLIDDCRKQRWPEIDFATATVEQISKITGRNFNLETR